MALIELSFYHFLELLSLFKRVGRTHTFLNTLYLANLDFATTEVKVSHSQQALIDENIRNKLANI